MKLNYFAAYAWGVVAYTIVVILFGDVVQVTGSGAGCGSHWPTCNGEVLPQLAQLETVIEFSHRITSGLALLSAVILLVWAFRAYPPGHHVRFGAKLFMFFMIVESLVGAALVVFSLVEGDTSMARVIVASLHLVNTLLLLGAVTLTAWWASGGPPIQLKNQGWMGWALGAGFLGLLVVGASGAVISLGDTLFPAETLAEGLEQKFDASAHFTVQLRLYHPLIAIAVGAYLVGITALFNHLRPTPVTQRMGQAITVLYVTQLAVGALNVGLLAALWIQLIHLFLSDMLLIALVLFLASAFAQPATTEQKALHPVAQVG